MANAKRKKSLLEDILDQAVQQGAGQPTDDMQPIEGAAAPVLPAGTAAAPEAASSTVNPLVPPAPGMVPTGWMYPQDGSIAAAMDTGDVNVAGTAPDAAPLAPTEGDDFGGDMEDDKLFDDLDDEEQAVLAEYRKWKKTHVTKPSRKKGAIKESAEEIPPVTPEETDIAEPPVDDIDPLEVLSDPEDELESTVSAEDITDEDIDDLLANLGDAAVDLGRSYKDFGGDIDALFDEINFDEEDSLDDEEGLLDDEGITEEDLVDGDVGVDDIDVDEPLDDLKGPAPTPRGLPEKKGKELSLKEAAERVLAKRKLENEAAAPLDNEVSYPAGSETNSDIDAMIEALEQRKNSLIALRDKKKKRMGLTEGEMADIADVDEADAEIGYDSVTSVVDSLNKRKKESAIKSRSAGATDKKFLERYEEKRGWNFKDLLDRGLLG